ncbi:unnamed protein product [Acanthoscelides obtectus]|uniref:Uncharacterized protein n=1 Tax=Acanthoscelides obtectus TaxID=200917 RepID=A0A9P0LXT8_ACAOB|nr:unnamed protein product [Acanthoscelides obtectus]CAK1671539.1 Ejaculatory bulb-specific protein 3 [Acanthoscelides obtectus]
MVLKVVILLLVCVVGFWCEESKYTTKYDNIDIDRILSNKRILTNYIKCLLDDGPCTPDGREFRKNIPDALQTGCQKCSEAQKKIVQRTSNYIRKTRPDDWDKIRKKFDPEGKYSKSFEQFLNEK